MDHFRDLGRAIIKIFGVAKLEFECSVNNF